MTLEDKIAEKTVEIEKFKQSHPNYMELCGETVEGDTEETMFLKGTISDLEADLADLKYELYQNK